LVKLKHILLRIGSAFQVI